MRHTRTPFKALTYNIYMVERGLRLHTGILVPYLIYLIRTSRITKQTRWSNSYKVLLGLSSRKCITAPAFDAEVTFCIIVFRSAIIWEVSTTNDTSSPFLIVHISFAVAIIHSFVGEYVYKYQKCSAVTMNTLLNKMVRDFPCCCQCKRIIRF